MKVVMADPPRRLLEERRRTGADRWDEVWDGVLHMPPLPNRDHQDLEGAMETWLRHFWVPASGGKVFHQINLARPGGWPDKDYRIPDLLLMTPDRFHIDENEYFEGAPAVVVEIRSPNDETYEKLDFYARLGVPEVWIIDRDSRRPELHQLAGDHYQLRSPSEGDWLTSPATGVQMREGGVARKLILQLGTNEATRRDVP
jgi:Uma2 family endonuclease